ncbi:MAG: acyl-CoA dehydrogenase family protein [Nostocoides sp.]
MDFTETEEHRTFRASLRATLERSGSLASVTEADRSETFNQTLWDAIADFGLCGIAISEEYGGSDADMISICIAVEELARASSAMCYAFLPTVTFSAKGIAKFGTEEQKRDILPRVARGEIRLAMGLTEPDTGSDMTGLSTRAVRDGDDFVINGQKVFTTGADTATYIFGFVRTDPESTGSKGLSVILIPTNADGVTVRPLRKLAGQSTHTCEVFLENVRVPATNLVGELGEGTKLIFDLMNGERILVGAEAAGLAQGVLDLALGYARQREQFGKPIIEHQAVGHMLADIAMSLETTRLLTYKAAWMYEQGMDCTTEASMAKVYGSEAGTKCANFGMQILGGYSYMVEYGMERYWRETKLYEIAGGTNQVLRNVISKQLNKSGIGR